MLYTFSQTEIDLLAAQLFYNDLSLFKDFGNTLPTFMQLVPIHYN